MRLHTFHKVGPARYRAGLFTTTESCAVKASTYSLTSVVLRVWNTPWS